MKLPQPVRSVLAIVAGYLVLALLVIASTAAAAAIFIGGGIAAAMKAPPNARYLAANLVCGLLAATIGGWVTARVAGRAPFVHASVLAALMALLMLPSVVAGGGPGQARAYLGALLAIGPGGVLLGGALRREAVRRQRGPEPDWAPAPD